MNRDRILKIIPKPTNTEVIIYDTSLKDLLDVDVFKEYKEEYNNYISKKQQYDTLKEEVQQYLNTINKAYLYNTSWDEGDYINMIRNEKKTYSTMYSDIKKIEDKISVSEKKLKTIEEKINLQKIKDHKKIEEEKQNIDDNIEKNKKKYFQIKDKLNEYENDIKYIQNRIDEVNNDKAIILKMKEDLNNDIFVCEYCGSKIKSHGTNSRIANRIENNLLNNSKQLDNLNQRKEKTELEIAYLENELRKIKQELNNDIEFKKQGKDIYIKKSIEVLKLEGLKSEMINYISNLEKSLKNQPHYNSNRFNEIKDKISKYELSLENLQKIKIAKSNMQEKLNQYNSLKKDLSNIEVKLRNYVKFISIYYKICEQKLNNFIGNNITFKLYSIDEYEIKEALKIYYNKVEYELLDTKAQENVDKILGKILYENI